MDVQSATTKDPSAEAHRSEWAAAAPVLARQSLCSGRRADAEESKEAWEGTRAQRRLHASSSRTHRRG